MTTTPVSVLTIASIPVDDLTPHPDNARRGDVDKIAASLDTFGQYKPIVVDKTTKHILAGNHTWAAAKQLGWTKIKVAWVNADTDQQLEILLADNRTSDLGSYDDKELAALLSKVADNDTLSGTGYEQADLDALLRNLEAADHPPVVADDEWTGMPNFEQDDLNSAYHTTIHFASDDDADKFFEHIGQPKSKSTWWPENDGHVGSTLHDEFVAVEAD